VAFASPRLKSLIFGPGDYSASVQARGLSIGASERYPGHVWHYAIHRIVVAARAAGLQVTDGPFADYRNLEGYRQSCEMALADGLGAIAIDGDMVDAATLKMAEIVSAKADAAGL